MVTAIVALVLIGVILAGFRYPGVFLGGTFATYQIGALINFQPITYIYVAIAGFGSVVLFLTNKGRYNPQVIDVVSFGLIFIFAVSMFWSSDQDKSLENIAQLFLAFGGMYVIGRYQTSDARQLLHQMCLTMAICGAALGICLIMSRATGTWGADHRLTLQDSEASAVGLSQPWPAMMLACVILLAEGKALTKLIGLGCLGVILYVVLVAATRSVLLAMVAGLIAYFVTTFQMKRLPMIIASSALLALVGVAAVFVLPEDQLENVLSRFGNLSNSSGGVVDPSTRERLELYQIAWRLIGEHPFTGVGYGGFGHYAFQDYPHNLFLEVLVSIGAFGFLFFLMWLVTIVISEMKFLFFEKSSGAILLSMTILTIIQLQVSFAFSMAKPLFLMVALCGCFLSRHSDQTASRQRATDDLDAILAR